MSREVCSCVLLQLLALFLAFAVHKAHSIAFSQEDCVDFDIAELESYLSQLNLRDVPSTRSMTGGFKCPVNALPFGALKSDWSRLLLLQDALPRESDLRIKLDRLFRILVVAYYRMEEKFDATIDHEDFRINSAASGISNLSTQSLYEIGEEREASTDASEESGDVTRKEYPSRGLEKIASKNLSATPAQKTQEASKLPLEGETWAIATSYPDPVSEMRRPQISRNQPPRMKQFWNYVVIPNKVASTSSVSTGPLSARGDEITVLRGDQATSAKQTNLDSNARKIFRWFYSPERATGVNALGTSDGKKGGCGAREEKDKSCCS